MTYPKDNPYTDTARADLREPISAQAHEALAELADRYDSAGGDG